MVGNFLVPLIYRIQCNGPRIGWSLRTTSRSIRLFAMGSGLDTLAIKNGNSRLPSDRNPHPLEVKIMKSSTFRSVVLAVALTAGVCQAGGPGSGWKPYVYDDNGHRIDGESRLNPNTGGTGGSGGYGSGGQGGRPAGGGGAGKWRPGSHTYAEQNPATSKDWYHEQDAGEDTTRKKPQSHVITKQPGMVFKRPEKKQSQSYEPPADYAQHRPAPKQAAPKKEEPTWDDAVLEGTIWPEHYGQHSHQGSSGQGGSGHSGYGQGGSGHSGYDSYGYGYGRRY